MKRFISAIIVDDESDSREVLESLLQKYCPEIKIVAMVSNVQDAYTMILELNPQLVFLDIQMPTGDGFSLLRKFTKVPFEVIFVTSYDQYAIDAIKFSALDYLLKPIVVSDLKDAIKKASASIQVDNNVRVVNLLHNLSSQVYEQKITVHTGGKVKMLNVSEIEFIEGDGRYSNIYTSDDEPFMTSKSLKEFEDYLGEDTPFIRISRSHLINTNHIVSYSKGEPCIIELKSNKTFEVARRKKKEILDKLKK